MNTSLRHSPDLRDAAQAAQVARRALAEQTEDLHVEAVAATARRVAGDARLWQWAALLHRALDNRREAIPAFARAAQLAPADASIAHGRARVVLEAGLDAVPLFDAAARLAPTDGGVLLGRAAARFGIGDAATAMAELEAMLAAEPRWIDGHQQLSRLRWMMGERAASTRSFVAALDRVPREETLWHGYIDTLMLGDRYEDAMEVIARGRRTVGQRPFLDATEAVIWSETGADGDASRAFERLSAIDDPALRIRHVRHLIRTGRIEEAIVLIDAAMGGAEAQAMTPYAAIVWRMMGDPRYEWLEGSPDLVSVVDLADRLPPPGVLAATLGALHRARNQHLDQSVRGGTQTDGALFSRIEPEVEAVRATVVAAVEAHISRLPPRDPAHPSLRPRRDKRPRFAGSWSVRLKGGGHHVNHVHPAGWISSALYVAVPERASGEAADAGWLTLGSPQAELKLHLPAIATVEPKPGRLVLFPSTMWHGTVPFHTGERLTIAFDIAAPLENS